MLDRAEPEVGLRAGWTVNDAKISAPSALSGKEFEMEDLYTRFGPDGQNEVEQFLADEATEQADAMKEY